MAQQWIRLYRETIHDPKLVRFTADYRYLWIVLMCLANDDAAVMLAEGVPYDNSELAALAGTDADVVEDAFKWFEKAQMIEYDEDGVIILTNWHERQFKSDCSTERVRKHRMKRSMKRSGNVSETVESVSVSVSVEDKKGECEGEEKETGARFAAFWGDYPNKIAKARATTAFSRLPKKDQKAALEALPRHVEYWTLERREKRFIPHATTWLNQRRWEDEINPKDAKPKPKGGFRGRGQRDPDFKPKF
jgi:predicted phage replisome organizer